MSMCIPTFQKDVYKEFHVHASHPDVTESYVNFTNRHGKYSNTGGNSVCFVGLQYFMMDSLLEEWNKGFFQLPKGLACNTHQKVLSAMVGYEVNVAYLHKLHDLGFLPLEIKALQEGTMVPYGVPTFTVRNTIKDYEWLPLMLETVASQENWPISTSATTAVAYFSEAKRAMTEAGMDLGMLPFMIHDFSGRGMFGKQAAAMSGFGHLAAGNCGTDTIPAVLFAAQYYGADIEKELVGASVNATEHSITCAWETEGEEAYARHLMTKVAPTGILAMVADTWDFWNWVEVIMPKLKDVIMAREGKLVTRPDSGDPVEVLCGIEVVEYESLDHYCDAVQDECSADCKEPGETGYSEATEIVRIDGSLVEISVGVEYGRTWMDRGPKIYHVEEVDVVNVKDATLTAEQKGLVESLWDSFGGETTEAGYKVLDNHVGAIYGDAITLDRQKQINKRLMDKGFAPQVILGVGSYSYQMVTRDTHGSAMKATMVVKAGVDTPIAKDPKTDAKKKSAKGFLRVDKAADGTLSCAQNVTREEAEGGELQTVFLNGKIVRFTTLAEIRQRVQDQI